MPKEREKKKISSVEDLIDLAKSVAEGDFYREINIALRGELARLADYINKTRENLQLLDPPLRESLKKIPSASYQLTDIFTATEEATHKILSLTEGLLDDQSHFTSLIGELQTIIGNASNNGEPTSLLDQMKNINLTNETRLIEIMTTLSFQDITGQKIKKIIELIDEVETKILGIIVAFGLNPDRDEDANADQKASEWLNKLKESSGSNATKQDLVDQILAEFAPD
jgi:chemotaxis protein CheZ